MQDPNIMPSSRLGCPLSLKTPNMGNTGQYTLSGLTNGIEYDIQVRAVNAVGNGSWSATAAGTPQTTADAPSIDLITPGNRALSAAWSAPSNTGGFAIISYDMRYIRNDASDKVDPNNWTLREDIWESGSLEHTITGLTNEVEYDVQVRAVNAVGNGPWSALAIGTPAPGQDGTTNAAPVFTEGTRPVFPILGVFRLNGQPKRDDGMIFGSCKARQSPVYPIRDAFLAVNHASCPSLSSSGPRQWGESALKTSRLPGALSLLAKSWLYPPSAWRRR